MAPLRTAAAVGVWLMLAVIVALLTGMARWSWAWLAMGMLFLVVPSQIAWQLTPPSRRVRVPVGLALVAGLGAGLVTAGVAPLSAGDLRVVERRLVLPQTWMQISQEDAGGPLCLPRCPTVTWEWEVNDRPAVAVNDAIAVLRSAGFRVVVSERDDGAVLDATSGRVQVDAVITAAEGRVPADRNATVRFSLTTRR